MRFAPHPSGGNRNRRQPFARGLAHVLLLCCTTVALASLFPWIQIAFASLWGPGSGPRAIETTTGLTCLLACVLTALLSSSEGRTEASRDAARAGSMVLMSAALFLIGRSLWAGPGMLRGVSASYSNWFYAAAAAVGIGALCAILRVRRPVPVRRRRTPSPGKHGD